MKYLFILTFVILFVQVTSLGQSKTAFKSYQIPLEANVSDYSNNYILAKVKKEYIGIFAGNSPSISINNSLLKEITPILNQKGLVKISNARSKPLQSDIKRIYKIMLPLDIDIELAINEAYQTGFFEIVEPAFNNRKYYKPNDTKISDQYYLENIKAFEGWEISKGDKDVIIAIIDEGLDFNHQDLKDNIYYNDNDPIDGIDNDNDGYIDNYAGWDFVGSNQSIPKEDNDPSVSSENLDHGTMVAGCAAATADNGIGIAGVAFNSKILITKHAGDNKEADNLIISRGYEGVIYAALMGADVINCSWGSDFYAEIFQDIIDFVVLDMDAVVVAAAGNDGQFTPQYPAGYEHVISVAALESNNRAASFSNQGITVDISAPGVDILTTSFNNNYKDVQGTSFASPIVAGAAALARAHLPEFNAQQINELIRVTADPIIYENIFNVERQLGLGI